MTDVNCIFLWFSILLIFSLENLSTKCINLYENAEIKV